MSLLESASLSFIPYRKCVLTAGLSYILYLFLFNIAVVSTMHDYFPLIHADYALRAHGSQLAHHSAPVATYVIGERRERKRQSKTVAAPLGAAYREVVEQFIPYAAIAQHFHPFAQRARFRRDNREHIVHEHIVLIAVIGAPARHEVCGDKHYRRALAAYDCEHIAGKIAKGERLTEHIALAHYLEHGAVAVVIHALQLRLALDDNAYTLSVALEAAHRIPCGKFL